MLYFHGEAPRSSEAIWPQLGERQSIAQKGVRAIDARNSQLENGWDAATTSVRAPGLSTHEREHPFVWYFGVGWTTVASLFMSRDTCSDSIVKLYGACSMGGVSHDYGAILGNIPVTTTTKIFPKVLRYKWEAYCNTNGGGVLRYKWEEYWQYSLSSECRGTKSTPIQIGGVLGRLIFYHYWCWRAGGAVPVKTSTGNHFPRKYQRIPRNYYQYWC